MSEDEKKRKEDLYAETRKDLLTRQLSNSEKFDGAILTLSTAALGVSLTFIKDIVPLNQAQDLCLLRASWWFFGFAILSTLFSFIASQLGITTQLDYAEQYYLKNKKEYLTKANIPSKITDVCNYLAALFFVIALILTINFVSINLRGNTVMVDNKGDKPTHMPFGANIPGMRPTDDDLLSKGAPIPNLRPAPDEEQTDAPSSTDKPQENEGAKQKE